MAIGATCVWEVRSTATAANANGGGYTSGGVDYSQQNAAQYSLTGVTTAAADAILLHASAASDMVGNIANITGGTNFTVGRYEIISVVAGTSITLDRTCTTAAGSAGTVEIGGALSIFDDAIGEAVEPGNVVHIKAATYTPSASITLAKDGTNTAPIQIIGYSAARNDNPAFGSQPVFAMGANSVSLGDYMHLSYIDITGTPSTLLTLGIAGLVFKCRVNDSSATVNRVGVSTGAASGRAFQCDITVANGYGVSMAGTQGVQVVENFIHDCAGRGISVGGNDSGVIAFNTIDTCAVAIDLGSGANYNSIFNNTCYSGTTGVALAATTGFSNSIFNNIFSGFTTGANSNTNNKNNLWVHNNFFNCTTDRTNVDVGLGDVDIDPAFVNAAGDDFTPGAAMYGIGLGGVFMGAIAPPQAAGGASGGARVTGAGRISGG